MLIWKQRINIKDLGSADSLFKGYLSEPYQNLVQKLQKTLLYHCSSHKISMPLEESILLLVILVPTLPVKESLKNKNILF